VSDKIILDQLKDYFQRYWENHKSIPKFKLIKNKFDLSAYKINKLMDVLANTGFLIKKYNHYYLNEKENGHKKKFSFKEIKEKVTEKKNDIVLIVLRILMIIIGIGAIILSTYYTSIWLFSFLPGFLAILLSSIMVAFSVAAFECIIIFKENKQGILIGIFSIIWLIVLCFSMVSTVAGQYNARMETEIDNFSKKSEEIHSSSILKSYINDEEEIKDQMEQKKKRLEYLNDFIISFSVEALKEGKNRRLQNNAIEELHGIEKELKALRIDLEKNREIQRDYLEEQKDSGVNVVAAEKEEEVSASFYVWLAEIFSINAILIEFWLSVFPAVFIDIIAPLAVAVGMFLKRKEKE
jgi:hypothetical protein